MVRAGIYIRVSKAKRELLDAQRQLPPCEAFAKAQGWSVEEVYLDDSISAHSGVRRDSFERMLRDVRAGKIDAIITWQADRLLRTVDDASAIVQIAKQHGTKIANVGGALSLDSAEGRRRFYEAAVAAQYESDLKSERLKLKHAEIAAAGGWVGGQRPYGYDLQEYISRDQLGPKVKYRLVINPEEERIISKAAKDVLEGRSISSVTREWAKSGIRRPNGGLFREQGIKELLVNPRIAGFRQVDGKLIKAAWDPIITKDQHLDLAAILKIHPHGGGTGGQRAARSYLLAGYATCGICGVKLSSKASEGRRRYACESRRGGCGRIKRAAEPVEAHVVSRLLIWLPQRLQEAARRTPRELQSLGTLMTARQTEEDRLEGLADFLTDGTLTKPEYLRQKQRISKRLKRLDDEIARIRAQARRGKLRGAYLHEERPEWDQLALDEQRAILGDHIERVLIKPVGPGTKRFDPDSVEIVWRQP